VGMVAGGNLGSPPIYMDGMGVGVTSGVGESAPRKRLEVSGWRAMLSPATNGGATTSTE
jgi:hypothetical protein